MSDLKILSYVRALCGINLLIFQLFVIVPNFSEIYSTESFFTPSLDMGFNNSNFSFSVLAHFNDVGRGLFLFLWVLCSFGLIIGVSSWMFWVVIIFLNSQFHGLNPLIVHEPQQILNFLILALPFLNCTKYNIIELLDSGPNQTEKAPLEVGLLTFFLGVYYFLAGAKKIPLESWQSGSGFKETLSWNGIARPWLENIEPYFENHYINPLLVITNHSILVFEILFLIIVFTKAKKLLIPLGIAFQLLNLIFFDVGLFCFIMLALYPVLLSNINFLDFIKALKNTFMLVKE